MLYWIASFGMLLSSFGIWLDSRYSVGTRRLASLVRGGGVLVGTSLPLLVSKLGVKLPDSFYYGMLWGPLLIGFIASKWLLFHELDGRSNTKIESAHE